MEKINRPDRKKLVSLIGVVNEMDMRLDKVAKCHDLFEKEAIGLIEGMYESHARKNLALVPIDELKSAIGGQRIVALRSVGYGTLADLSNLSRLELEAIDGVGNVTAEAIESALDKLEEEYKETYRVHLEPGECDDLLRALHGVLHSREISRDAKELYEKTHEEIVNRLMDARAGDCNLLVWMLRSQRRKALVDSALAYLSHLQEGSYGEIVRRLSAAREALEAQDMETIVAHFEKNSATYYALLDRLNPRLEKELRLDSLSAQLNEEISSVPLSGKHLKSTLRRYQEFAVRYVLNQKRVLLGDEMGIGKTVEALGVMTNLRARGFDHFLVVCPLGILINWTREVVAHTALEAFALHGTDEDILSKWIKKGGVLVANYETVRKIALPEGMRIGMVVVDEAHYIKNPKAQRTQTVRKLFLNAEYILLMTGTPLENNVQEMCNLVAYLDPAKGEELKANAYASFAPGFRKALSTVYLRRKREDVMQELPDMIVNDEWCMMSAEDELLYRYALKTGNFMEIRRVGWHWDNALHSSKGERLCDLVEMAREEHRKVIVFSYFKETLRLARELLDDACLGQIDGSVNNVRRQEILDQFEAAKEGTVLLMQIVAGGVGLNIQSASMVVFCEPQLKPSLESQAVSRVYRMGQRRNVLVHRLLCAETVDERILSLLEMKQSIFDLYADESEAGIRSQREWIQDVIDAEKKKHGVMEDSPLPVEPSNPK